MTPASLIIGLTGGIGSGKSAVAEQFRELGIEVVDADQASRQVVQPGSPALAKIAEHFGAEVLLSSGELNRPALRKIVFDNENERRWLEQLLHPLINRWIQDRLAAATSPYAILESPLLLEGKQREMVARVMVVDVPEALQIERASRRDANSEDQIKAIIASQMPRQQRLAKADDIIDNSGSLDNLREQVAALHQQYLQLTHTNDSID